MFRTFLSATAIALSGAVLLVVIGALFLYTLDSAVRARSRDELYQRVIGASVIIEQRVERSLSAAAAVAAVIEQRGGRTAGLEPLAAQLLQHFAGLTSVQIAPQGRVALVYPRSQAPARLGRTLAGDPALSDALAEAASTRTMTTLPAAPGNPGAVTGVMPVFVPLGGGGERLWGYVLAEVDLQRLLGGLALPALLGGDTRYALASSQTPQQILASGGIVPEAPIAIPLTVFGSTWQLLAESRPGWRRIYGQTETYLMIGLLLGLTAMLALITAQRGQMRKLALYDALTGLPNRRLFFERAAQALAQARRVKKGVGVLYVDVDDFKSINDRYGHDAGDEVLRHVGAQLRALVREADVVARLAGDEFVLLLPDAGSLGELDIVAGKIVGAMRAPATVRGRAVQARVTTGASLFPDDGEQIDALLARADERMYAAKRGAPRT